MEEVEELLSLHNFVKSATSKPNFMEVEATCASIFASKDLQRKRTQRKGID